MPIYEEAFDQKNSTHPTLKNFYEHFLDDKPVFRLKSIFQSPKYESK
jgi:hypothetical protein